MSLFTLSARFGLRIVNSCVVEAGFALAHRAVLRIQAFADVGRSVRTRAGLRARMGVGASTCLIYGYVRICYLVNARPHCRRITALRLSE